MAKKKQQEIVFRGDHLRELREEKGLTQEELAATLYGTADPNKQKYISRWETGLYNPDLADLRVLCRFFDVTADYFLGETADRHGRSPSTGDDVVGPNIDRFDTD